MQYQQTKQISEVVVNDVNQLLYYTNLFFDHADTVLETEDMEIRSNKDEDGIYVIVDNKHIIDREQLQELIESVCIGGTNPIKVIKY